MADHGLTWGVLPAGTFDRVLVFSPHFDDAAMGAGHLLLAHPGSTVVTRTPRGPHSSRTLRVNWVANAFEPVYAE